MTPRTPPRPDPEHIHNDATATGDHSIAAGNIRNVFIRWALQHPSARWLPLLLACAALIIAGTTWPDGPASQYALWGVLAAVSLGTATGRVLIQRPAVTRVVAALSLVSVLATVGGYLAFRNVVTHGEIDVTGRITPPVQRALSNGSHVTLSLDIATPEESRNALRLTLAINDHDTASPTCRPDSSADLTLLGSGRTAQPTTVRHGGTADFLLGGQVRTVRIDVQLRTAQGCLLDIRTTQATLYDT
ncbi:hypothetical protein ACO0M4_39710 [Streptomyces sp. RGM 3693]|uniref:hypothetical protein n=1 Tax=Streptomyces sp. RGM 3693 TaxID=3413284 RepID=UPI003D2B2D29